jgi:uncharacterized membrane protein YdbT with pleckstrin-like domain
METELKIWEGRSSQWVCFSFYLLCAVLTVVLGLGLLLALWKYLDTRLNTFKITNQRIIEKRGILSVRTNQLELFRVKDIQLDQPFVLRLFGLSNIILTTSDVSNPVYKIRGIEHGAALLEHIRVAVDQRRDIKGVRELDF